MKIKLDSKEVMEIVKTYALDVLLQPVGSYMDISVIESYGTFEIEVFKKEVEDGPGS